MAAQVSAAAVAVMATSGSNEGNPNVYFVDCVISNCQGAASVFHGGTYVRCLIADNNFRKAPSASAVVVSCAGKFFNCVFTRNHSTGNAFFSGSGDANYSTFLNCSFVDNLAGFYSYTGMRWYNCLTSVSSWPNDGGIRTNSVKDTTATRMLMAPSLGDWRVRKGSAAENGGAMEYFADESIISLPSSVDRYRDFCGSPVDRSQTTLCLGAVQDVAVAAGGAIVGANANVTFDAPGRKLYDAAYVHPCVYPTNYLVGVNLAEGKRIRCFELAGHGTGERNYICPSDRVDDRRWIISPPDPEAVMTVNYRSAPVRYVDANTAVAEAEQDGSAERPFSTLQGAVDRLDLTDAVIVVKPGVYDKGYGVTSFDGGALMARSRVRVPETKSLRFVAEAGPEKTFIVGAPDPDNLNGDGCGDGATMTISIGNTQTFQGFTITGGYSPSGVTFGSGRGSIYSYGQDLHLVDCVITNNHGRNTALGTARFERCRIENNTGSKGLTMAGKFISCIIAGNAVTGDGEYVLDDWYNNVDGVENGYWSTYALSCSVSGDGVHGLARGRSAHSKLVNSALDRGGHISVSDEHYASVYGSVLGGFSGYAFPGDYVTGDPMLIGGAQFDARTYVNSPVNTSAKSPAEDPSGVWWYLCTSDFYGNPWRYDAAGRPVAGAVQDSVTGGAYIGRGSGGLEIVSGAQFGYNDLEAGSSVTVKITDGAKRPLTGLLVNGVTNLIEKNASLLSGLTLECGDGVGNSVIPLYSPVNAWYVDAVNGDDDANFGYAPGCAWKTLERAFRNANLVAGDKVVARLRMAYLDRDTAALGKIGRMSARAVVPAGVTLESSAGSSVTFIRGEPAGTDDVSTSAAYNAAMKGLGKTAVRGVYLDGANSVVRGFTFTDCYTRGASDAGGALHGNVDGCGAGVAGAGRAERCVFTGCHAFRGGGVYKASAVDCVFDGCHALYAGGASSDNRNYGCLTRNNVCTGNAQWGGFFYWNVCDNCTVLDSLGGPSGSAYPLRNALVVGKMGPWDWNKNNLMDELNVVKKLSGAASYCEEDL